MIGMAENKGCAYGKVTRERVDNFIKLFEDFKNNDFVHLEKSVEKLGKRPSWITTVIMIILSNLVVGLALAQILGK